MATFLRDVARSAPRIDRSRPLCAIFDYVAPNPVCKCAIFCKRTGPPITPHPILLGPLDEKRAPRRQPCPSAWTTWATRATRMNSGATSAMPGANSGVTSAMTGAASPETIPGVSVAAANA